MQDCVAQTSAGLAIRATARTESIDSKKAQNGCKFKHKPIQNVPSSIIIKANKATPQHNSLKFKMLLIPLYSCGLSLKTIVAQDESCSIHRIARFPTSIFQIDDLSEKERKLLLVSNIAGTKYNLLEGNQLLLTLSFKASLCPQSSFRQFSIYYLASRVSYQSLIKPKELAGDLQFLFLEAANAGNIKRLVNQSPKLEANGEYSLRFRRQNVQPAVQNSKVVDLAGDLCLQMVKLGDDAYEMSWRHQIRWEWAISLALASLDFKWALQ